ncbi:Geranylgeranyl transferase type-1 subunit beta [Escovopsis weberi]|uniref:Geranylgeranyl transferase type-1 subunit beta n=1 Tax=Escovopsis weberi TaxID=150374 RepID=A0A0M8MXP0_ESCWE|nr:Geranylgeranyl transferase type-1 subunit beta [Escovopsis weberi]
MAEPRTEDSKPRFNKAKHIAYWRRCHETFLPSAYTSNDSTRLTFAFFIVAALDLLRVPLTKEHRAATRAWVLGLQHPDGGFCGSPTHAMPAVAGDAGRGTANLAATFFALLLLGAAAETEDEQRTAFAGVDRRKLLRWLRRLQRRDGSFGQVLWEGEPLGGRDMRHSYLAAGVRWMLKGGGAREEEEDVDVEKMVEHIRGVQTYDGGISESSQQESHAGYAYCAVAALALLDRAASTTCPALQQGIADRGGLLKWLAHRQFVYRSADEERQDESEVNYVEAALGEMSLDEGCARPHRHVGFNGRWNKKADTCYAWWLLGSPGLFDAEPTRNYLLEVTQHGIGGFSKNVGGPPDLYHSYLGLTALAMMGQDELREVDVGLCCSRETVDKIERARDGLLEAVARGGDGDGDGKSKSQFYDPCQEAAKRSYNCLFRNNGDKTMCGEYFQAYRDCKEAWTKQRKKETGSFW